MSNTERTLGGKPTSEELAHINKFAMRQMDADEVYVFNPLMIDDQETCYHSTLHTNFLNKIMQDTMRGAALLMNHNNRQLPVGRSFDSKVTSELSEDGKQVASVYGKYYIDLGRNTQGGMTTDDIAKGIDAGTIFDVSIGFNASSWKCSVCNNDIRDYMNCPHIPGETYEVKGDDGVFRNQRCLVVVGEDGQGELLELSLVYAGACNRATIKQTFSNEGVRNSDEGTKLLLVDNFKNIPVEAKIFQYYTKDGSILMTDTDERTDGAEYLRKRSEEKVELEKILGILKEAGLEFETDEELSTKLTSMLDKSELENVKTELADKTAELETANTELANASVELAKKDETIADLTKANEELSAKAGLVDTFKSDLIKETIEAGIRAHGNTFAADVFEKFLGTLSIDEIKDAKAKFDASANERFEGARVSKPEDRTLENRLGNEYVPDKDEEPEAFSAFVADKAMEYSKANNVSIKEATKLMYAKYTKRSEE